MRHQGHSDVLDVTSLPARNRVYTRYSLSGEPQVNAD